MKFITLTVCKGFSLQSTIFKSINAKLNKIKPHYNFHPTDHGIKNFNNYLF